MSHERKRPRAFLLQNGLKSPSSHFLQETLGWLNSLEASGFEVIVHANGVFAEESIAGYPVHRTFHVAPDSTVDGPLVFRRLQSFVEGNAIFALDCRALEADNPGADDLIIIPYATESEMMGLAKWLHRRQLQHHPLPRIAALIHRPDYDWQWDPETEALQGELAAFAYASHTLREVGGCARVALLTTNEGLARVLERHIGVPFLAGCAPIYYPPEGAEAPPRWDFAFLGQMRPEKGSRILSAIVSGYLAAQPKARIAIQCDSPGEPEAFMDGYAGVAEDPRIDWLMGPQDSATFSETLRGAACILLPCEPARYQLRISGIFAEALGAGRPVVVSSPTWMADMLRQGHGAGMAVRRLTPATFVRGLLQVHEQRDDVLARARDQAAPWRAAQSLSRLVTIIEQALPAA